MNSELDRLLALGAGAWNDYRARNPEFGADDGSYADEDYAHWVKRTKHIVPIDLTDADLSGRDFSHYNLGRATFLNAVLIGARFQCADLTSACFDGCNCEDAAFVGANLNLVGFFRCRLDGARFVGCTGIVIVDDTTQFHHARINGSALQFVSLETMRVGQRRWTAVATSWRLLGGEIVGSKPTRFLGEIEEIQEG